MEPTSCVTPKEPALAQEVKLFKTTLEFVEFDQGSHDEQEDIQNVTISN